MKKLTRFLGSFIFALALSSAAWTQSRPNQVVDQMIQALGGSAFLDVKEIHASGRFFSFFAFSVSALVGRIWNTTKRVSAVKNGLPAKGP